tara:strand:+ start:1419 stop:1928 length:510 start_codon:yes stop_codon:yes gene_type:complete
VNSDILIGTEKISLISGIGNPISRMKVMQRLKEKFDFQSPIHPNTIIYMKKSCEIGKGTVIGAGNILTVDVKIGEFCSLNLNCTVGHDSILEDFVGLAPNCNISGNVHIGKATYIGTGAKVIQGINIGRGCVIGAGSVVIRDIPDFSVAVGVPTEIKKINERAKKVLCE